MWLLRLIVGFVTLISTVGAQALTVTASNQNPRPGDVVTLSYNLVPPGANPQQLIAAMQWDATSSLPESPRAAGAVITAAGKNLYCSQSPVTAANSRCLIVGITAASQGVLQNGMLATSTVVIPANASLGAVFTVKTTGPIAAAADSTIVPLAAGPDLTLTVAPRREDLNGDGIVDAKDILLLVSQVLSALAGAPCPTAMDLNGDGACTIQDVQLVAAKIQ